MSHYFLKLHNSLQSKQLARQLIFTSDWFTHTQVPGKLKGQWQHTVLTWNTFQEKSLSWAKQSIEKAIQFLHSPVVDLIRTGSLWYGDTTTKLNNRSREMKFMLFGWKTYSKTMAGINMRETWITQRWNTFDNTYYDGFLHVKEKPSHDFSWKLSRLFLTLPRLGRKKKCG